MDKPFDQVGLGLGPKHGFEAMVRFGPRERRIQPNGRSCQCCYKSLHKKGRLSPPFTHLCLPSLPLGTSNAHLRCAAAHAGYFSKGAVGQIKNATAIVRAPIVDSDGHSLAVGWIDHFNFGAKGKVAMGSSEAMSIEAFPIGSSLPIEAISVAIP